MGNPNLQNYIVTGLISVEPSLPLQLWDGLRTQATITLNMLHLNQISPSYLLPFSLDDIFLLKCLAYLLNQHNICLPCKYRINSFLGPA